jgi:TRAP-type C4-dicarboxylate transport system permease large subunit
MKKIKSPWYGVTWIGIWTVALIWFLSSGLFNRTECIGLVLVWAILVGVTVYLLVKRFKTYRIKTLARPAPVTVTPSLNGPCPCGSGKKYKRCCGK